MGYWDYYKKHNQTRGVDLMPWIFSFTGLLFVILPYVPGSTLKFSWLPIIIASIGIIKIAGDYYEYRKKR